MIRIIEDTESKPEVDTEHIKHIRIFMARTGHKMDEQFLGTNNYTCKNCDKLFKLIKGRAFIPPRGSSSVLRYWVDGVSYFNINSVPPCDKYWSMA